MMADTFTIDDTYECAIQYLCAKIDQSFDLAKENLIFFMDVLLFYT